MPTQTKAQIIGQMAEDQACTYLRKQGLRFVTRNYRCRMGEIDLIFRDQTTLVFVEVRYRKSTCFGSAAETVGYRKQHKLIKAALHYIQHVKVFLPCRFDVIAMQPTDLKSFDIEWIRDAFCVEC
jgi:putative endonuclease